MIYVIRFQQVFHASMFSLEVLALSDRTLRRWIKQRDRLTNDYLPNTEARNGYKN
jgi:hypothetical protein